MLHLMHYNGLQIMFVIQRLDQPFPVIILTERLILRLAYLLVH